VFETKQQNSEHRKTLDCIHKKWNVQGRGSMGIKFGGNARREIGRVT
jgi:hypothetical protein